MSAADDASSGAEILAEDGGRYLGLIRMSDRRKKAVPNRQCDDYHGSSCKRENEASPSIGVFRKEGLTERDMPR
jgi:hypothetical protein